MTNQFLKSIIEAALFAAGKPLTIDHFLDLFAETERPERSLIRAMLRELGEDYAERGIELVQVASGYRFQTKQNLTPWLKRLQPERTPRYSRALLETIAIIAYRQPITRGEIETIRGISVSTDLIKKLQDYNWIRVLAHRDTPGRPALYGTTREFLNYFNLKTLNDLPPLAELKEIEGQMDMFDYEDKQATPDVEEKDKNPVAASESEKIDKDEDKQATADVEEKDKNLVAEAANEPESEKTEKEVVNLERGHE
jgi:segregation and condensation protein B